MERADESPAAQHFLGGRTLVHEVEQRDGDLVVDLLALLGVDEWIDADVGDDELALERERAQLLGQCGRILYGESLQVRAMLEDRLQPHGEVFLDRWLLGVKAS